MYQKGRDDGQGHKCARCRCERCTPGTDVVNDVAKSVETTTFVSDGMNVADNESAGWVDMGCFKFG